MKLNRNLALSARYGDVKSESRNSLRGSTDKLSDRDDIYFSTIYSAQSIVSSTQSAQIFND